MPLDSQNPKLRPYQYEDVNFLSQLDCAGCFNEQRTGKTPTALMTLKTKGLQDAKILIVTTSSALYQWKDEYIKWLERECIVCDGTPTQKKNKIEKWTKGLVISLGSLKTTTTNDGCLALILSAKPDAVILDEAHQIRNPKTFAAKSCFKLTKIPIRLALTGTPAYGEAKDIFSILKFLFPERFNSPWKFYEEYLIPEKLYIFVGGRRQCITQFKNFIPAKEKQLMRFLSAYCTQRKRKEVMKWLPEKDKQTIRLPLTTKQQKYLKELAETYETENLVTQGVLDRLVRYRQICLDPKLLDLQSDSPKTKWILDFIEENPNTPIIIFSMFTQYLRSLFETLSAKHIKEAMIIGEVAPNKRSQFTKDFQSGKFNVFLINLTSGKEGLTLDRAEAVIFTDLYPPIGAIEQAEDRFVSTSEDRKDKPHVVYNLVMQDSFDEDILKLLQERKTETEVINNFRKELQK